MSGMGTPVGARGHLWVLASPVGAALTVTGNATPSYCRFTTATDTAGMRRSSWDSGSASAGRTSARAGRRGDVKWGVPHPPCPGGTQASGHPHPYLRPGGR